MCRTMKPNIIPQRISKVGIVKATLKGLPGTGSIRKPEVLPRVTLFIAINICLRSVAHAFKNV